MEDFMPFELVVKLKEKGFSCEYPFAMYNEDGEFYPLYSSDKYYYEISDFDSRDFIAPTISQVLKWLREERKLHIEPCILASAYINANGGVINEFTYWSFRIVSIVTGDMIYFEYEHGDDKRFDSYEQATLAGIEYVLDNLI